MSPAERRGLIEAYAQGYAQVARRLRYDERKELGPPHAHGHAAQIRRLREALGG